MNSRFAKFIMGPGIIGLMVLLMSCNDRIPKRSTISSGNQFGGPICEENFTLNEETNECVENPTVLTRPLNAVFFKDDFCVCKDGKAYSANTCASFCASKATSGQARLYANFTVKEDISLNPIFGNINGWCNVVLESEGSQAGCKLEAKDSEGNIEEPDVVITGNSIVANVSALSEDKTYQLKLVQKSSPATSDVVQVIRYSVDVGSSALGVLKPAAISQYTCVVKVLTPAQVGNDVYSDAAYRIHYYFYPGMAPNAVPAGTDTLVCHDPILNGINDSEEFPRLELKPGVFYLWDVNDPRFYNNNGVNSKYDVNDIIVQKTRNYGATIPATTNLFASFTWPGSPTFTSTENGNTVVNKPIGFYMAPWVDTNTSLSYCLTSSHYNSTNALYRAIGDVVQTDTEGLYVGEKAAEPVTLSNGDVVPGLKDYILIRESDLKKVWFYYKNSILTAPTDANVRSNTVYFYYPLNPTTPFVKSAGQKLYRVRGADELSNSSSSGTSTDGGTSSVVPPHDRKIGCIPKI